MLVCLIGLSRKYDQYVQGIFGSSQRWVEFFWMCFQSDSRVWANVFSPLCCLIHAFSLFIKHNMLVVAGYSGDINSAIICSSFTWCCSSSWSTNLVDPDDSAHSYSSPAISLPPQVSAFIRTDGVIHIFKGKFISMKFVGRISFEKTTFDIHYRERSRFWHYRASPRASF